MPDYADIRRVAFRALIGLSFLSSGALAQSVDGNPGWTGTLGGGAVVFPKYTGGNALQAVPLPIAYVDYNGWFHVNLFRAGAYFWASENKKQGLSIAMEPRIGFRSGEGPRLAGLAARRSSIFGGPAFNAENDWGSMSLGYFTDLSNASRGGYYDLLLNRPLLKNERWDVSGSLELSRQNAKVVNYYFGVSSAEATPGRAAYAPGSATNATLWLTGQYNLDKRYAVMFGANVMRLGASAAASPIVERRDVPFLYLGLGINL